MQVMALGQIIHDALRKLCSICQSAWLSHVSAPARLAALLRFNNHQQLLHSSTQVGDTLEWSRPLDRTGLCFVRKVSPSLLSSFSSPLNDLHENPITIAGAHTPFPLPPGYLSGPPFHDPLGHLSSIPPRQPLLSPGQAQAAAQ